MAVQSEAVLLVGLVWRFGVRRIRTCQENKDRVAGLYLPNIPITFLTLKSLSHPLNLLLILCLALPWG